MKTLARLLLVVILLVVVVVVLAILSVDRLARTAIEKGATYALGVPTTLDRADIGIMSGEFAMDGLNVANPSGFDTPHFMRLGNGGVALSFASLGQEVIELPRLSLSGLDMNLQRTGGGSNYGVILDHLKRFESSDPATDDQAGGTRFLIRTVEIKDVTVHLNLVPEGGELTRIDVPVGDISLKDVGSDTSTGVLLSELAGVLIKAVIAAAVEKGGGLIPADIAGELRGKLAQLEGIGDLGMQVVGDVQGQVDELTGAAIDDLGNKADQIGKDLEDKAGDVIDNLGGLLGGKKDQ